MAFETVVSRAIRFMMWWWCVVRYNHTPLGQLISFLKQMAILSTAIYRHYHWRRQGGSPSSPQLPGRKEFFC